MIQEEINIKQTAVVCLDYFKYFMYRNLRLLVM